MKKILSVLLLIWLCGQNNYLVLGQDKLRYIQHTPISKGVAQFLFISASRQQVINHLLQGEEHKGKVKKTDLDLLSIDELEAIHNDDHDPRYGINYALLAQVVESRRPKQNLTVLQVQQPEEEVPVIEPRPAVVIVSLTEGGGGCSGFCYHPKGLVMTAKHCGTHRRVKIWFPKQGTVDANLVYVSPEAEGPIVYRISTAGDYPFMFIADKVSAVREKVIACGYPKLRKDRYYERQIALTGSNRFSMSNSNPLGISGVNAPYMLNTADEPIIIGTSGGPLLNMQGEVTGMASTSDQRTAQSGWITHKAIRTAYEATVAVRKPAQQPIPDTTQIQEKLTLVAFSIPNCGGCNDFARDNNAGKFVDYNVVINKFNGQRWQDASLIKEYQDVTGRNFSDKGFPLLWVRGTSVEFEGYSSANCSSICAFLKNAVKTAFQMSYRLGKLAVGTAGGALKIGVGGAGKIIGTPSEPVPKIELLPEPPRNPVPLEKELPPEPILKEPLPEEPLEEVIKPTPEESAPKSNAIKDLLEKLFSRPKQEEPMPEADTTDKVVPQPPEKEIAQVPISTQPVLKPLGTELNADTVSIAVFISRPGGTTRKLPIESNMGIVDRRSNEIFKSKLKVDLIIEGQSNLYATATAFAKVNPDPAWVLVLTKDVKPEIKNGVRIKVEQLMKNLLPAGTPIEVLSKEQDTEDWSILNRLIETKGATGVFIIPANSSIKVVTESTIGEEKIILEPVAAVEPLPVPKPTPEIVSTPPPKLGPEVTVLPKPMETPKIVETPSPPLTPEPEVKEEIKSEEVAQESVSENQVIVNFITLVLGLLGFDKAARVFKNAKLPKTNLQINKELEEMIARYMPEAPNAAINPSPKVP